jgi:CSLREA domain-containing protein
MNGSGLSGESHGIFWARRNLVAAVVAAIFVFIAMLAMASPALADSFVVTTTDDTPVADAAVCDSNCSLREAVKLANSNAAADTITFGIPDAGPHTITLTKGQIFFATTHKTTLDGSGESVTVSGNGASRVFNVREGNVTVKRLTVSGGYVGGCCDNDGGGIYVQGGNLAVIESTVSGNTATTGGGIFSFTNLSGTSTTTIENSTISGNTATFRGGGIYNDHGRTTITSSTITENYASSLYQSSGGGAGVASYGDTSTETVVANSIISDNSSNCSVESACIFRHDGDVDFVSGGLHPHNSFTSQGYNIIGDSSLEYDTAYRTAGTAIGAFNKTGDQKGVTDPKLGSLQDNGGLTQTHALLTGSPAINRGSTTLATDQRGVSRPQGAADDVGAFELEIAVNVAPSFTKGADQTVDEDASAQTVTGWATAISSGPSNESTQTVSFTATNNNNALFSDQPQVSSDGTLTYTPAENANGTATVTVTANDSGGTADGGVDTSAAQTFTITVTAVDDNPVAVNDTKTVAEDDAATAINVLANDTDIDGGPKTIASVTQPTNGTVELTGGTTGAHTGLTYKPDANYCNGGGGTTANFTYTLNGGSEATVNMTVTCVNDKPSFTSQGNQTANEDSGAQTVTGWVTNFNPGPANESAQQVADYIVTDTSGNAVNSNLFTNTGQPDVSNNGTLTYTPASDANGSITIKVKVQDNGGTANGGVDTSDAQDLTITVSSVNDEPVANDDNAGTTPEDTAITIQPGTLLGNDAAGPANESGQNLHISAVSNPSDGNGIGHGNAVLNSDGSVTFTPDDNYNSDASFEYTVCDDGGTTNGGVNCYYATAVVKVIVSAVNDAPVATDGTESIDEDAAPISIDFGALVSDVETSDANLTYNITAPPAAKGTLSGSGSTRTFDSADDFNGTIKIPYTVTDRGDPDNCGQPSTSCDAPETSVSKTVTVTVRPVNDAPVATGGTASMDEDAPAIQINLGALVSDKETADANLSYTVVSGPTSQQGTLTADPNTNGVYSFDSAQDFNGQATFTYKVTDRGDPDNCGTPGTACDAPETSISKTVTITVNPVNDPPTVTLASGGSCSTSTTSVSGTMNLSLADVDSSGVLTLSATSSNQALVPVANIKFGGSGANRMVSIVPAAKKSGSATIAIIASDGTAKSSTTTIQVIVGTDRKETIGGTSGADMIFGQNGDDTINAGNSNDLVCGGNAGGVISGGAGDDTLDGGNGNDVLRGDAGKDIVRGSAGNDTLTGGSEADSFDGGSGTDVATDYNAAEGDTRTNIP